MKTKPILIKFLISAVSVMMMLATTSSGTAYADVEPGIDLSDDTGRFSWF